MPFVVVVVVRIPFTMLRVCVCVLMADKRDREHGSSNRCCPVIFDDSLLRQSRWSRDRRDVTGDVPRR